MTTILDAPEDFATTALAGFAAIYVRHVKGGVVRATKVPKGKFSVVIGGGSGHYPAFAVMSARAVGTGLSPGHAASA